MKSGPGSRFVFQVALQRQPLRRCFETLATGRVFIYPALVRLSCSYSMVSWDLGLGVRGEAVGFRVWLHHTLTPKVVRDQIHNRKASWKIVPDLVRFLWVLPRPYVQGGLM